MWKRLLPVLRCPICKGSLRLQPLAEHQIDLTSEVRTIAERRGIATQDLTSYVDEGLLLCDPCKLRFPVTHGLPVLLPYTTRLHGEFDTKLAGNPGSASATHRFPEQAPVRGEEFVRESFSTEWLEYDYDGVIWELTYEAHAERIAREIGPAMQKTNWHLEVGCGLGLATTVVQESSGCDAVGLDLSLAALKAAQQYRNNPFMHFVQASAFSIPLAQDQFDTIYSRGVLHHTYSTERAFRSVALHCAPGGTFYMWLYGPGSVRATPLRAGLYGLEALTRPIVARAPGAPLAKAFLGTMALGYVTFNRLRRLRNPAIQKLTFSRGVHAARDRFTPRFAHRHPAEEILKWYAEAGYESATVLDWRDMPPAERSDFSRNVGIRAIRTT